jgi:hypothetical protein
MTLGAEAVREGTTGAYVHGDGLGMMPVVLVSIWVLVLVLTGKARRFQWQC